MYTGYHNSLTNMYFKKLWSILLKKPQETQEKQQKFKKEFLFLL